MGRIGVTDSFLKSQNYDKIIITNTKTVVCSVPPTEVEGIGNNEPVIKPP